MIAQKVLIKRQSTDGARGTHRLQFSHQKLEESALTHSIVAHDSHCGSELWLTMQEYNVNHHM